MTTARPVVPLGVAMAMFAAIACSGSSVQTEAAQGVVVTVTPDAVTLAAGGQLAFTASVTGTANPSTTWSVAEGAAGGSITAAGLYTAPATAGTYHVVATSDADPQSTATATVTITAGAATVVTMTVSPVAATIGVGASQAFSCAVLGSTDTGCTWSVQEGSAGGGVTTSGVYTAPTAAGTYHVVATSHADPTQHAVATVTVTSVSQPIAVSVSPVAVTIAAGASQSFTCTVTGSADTACTWSVREGTSGGTVTSAGTYTAPQTTGTYHVVAKSHADSTKSATATVTVTAPPPQTAVAVSPTAATLVAGASQSFSCTVTGSADTACTWSVREGATGGTVTSAGRYTAPQTAGTYHVVATSHADATKAATATVTVTAPPAVTVAVSPLAATLVTGTSQTFTCSITGSTDTACTWSVQEGSAGGAITTGGVYTAPQVAGTYHVIATSHADATKSATAAVTVTAPPVVTISLTPAATSLDACQAYTFRATVTGSSNTAVTWSVSEGSTGGSVTSSGVYTAPSTGGTYHVVATSQADSTKSQSATVTVTERIVSVSVAPNTTTVTPGGTVQFTATVTTTCGAFTSTQAVAAVN